MSRFLLILLAALAVAAAAPGAAQAACTTSTPSTAVADDPATDAETASVEGPTPGELFVVSAPEITRVTGSLDGVCTISYDTVLTLPPGETEPLVVDESLRYYLDVDANPATGGTVTGAEWLVFIDGRNGSDLSRLMRWNGAAFAQVRTILITGAAGFTLNLADLGIADPATVGVRVHSRLALSSSKSLVDIAPDKALPQLLHTLAWVVPPPPAPAPAPAPAPLVPAASSCTIPPTKGLRRVAALNALRGAGCTRTAVVTRRSRKVRKGRVIATIPAAGTATTGVVQVVISKGAKKR